MSDRDLVKLRLLAVDEERVRLPEFGQKFPVERQLGHSCNINLNRLTVVKSFPSTTKRSLLEDGYLPLNFLVRSKSYKVKKISISTNSFDESD